MSCPRFAAPRLVLLLILPLSAGTAKPASCVACDGAAFCAWQSTWHAPYALDTPLRGYFIPRMPGRCDRGIYSDGLGYDGGCGSVVGPTVHGHRATPGVSLGYSPDACIRCEPGRFQRLGQIPNDFDLSGGGAAGEPSR